MLLAVPGVVVSSVLCFRSIVIRVITRSVGGDYANGRHLACSSSSFLACNSRLRSAIHRHHPPQRAVLSQLCCFGERKVVVFQILLDGAEPRDVGTS